MRQESDGDIVPTKKDIEKGEQMFKDLLELVGEDNEYAQDFKDSIKTLKRSKKSAK